MTDADNCCPWLGCIPLPSSLKTRINLCFQSYSPPPGPPADPSPVWPPTLFNVLPPCVSFTWRLFCATFASCPSQKFAFPSVLLFFLSLSEHFFFLLLIKGRFCRCSFVEPKALITFDRRIVYREEGKTSSHAVAASYDFKRVAATVGNARSYEAYIQPHAAFQKRRTLLRCTGSYFPCPLLISV